MTPYPPLPEAIAQKLAEARRLEWWSLFWLATIVGAMALTMGGSQAMKAAWIEDMLSLAPPILFLGMVTIERLAPTRHYPFGFHRAGTLAFMLSAAALTVMGGYLAYDAATVLLGREHPTIGAMRIFGTQIWAGWVMIAALVYSVIPPVILGRKKLKIARILQDKVLHTDARMNAADWKTGLAGVAGLIGIAFGYWWADAVAAGLIGLDVLWDGLKNLRIAVAELLDGAPRTLNGRELLPIDRRIDLRDEPFDTVKIRESGRYLHVVYGTDEALLAGRDDTNLGEHAWRVVTVSRAGSCPDGDGTPG